MTEFWIPLFFVLAGTFFMFVAGFGIFRMEDVYIRMHAATKAASLGVGLLLIGAAVHFGDLAIATKALVTTAFVFLTAPVAAHMLGRSAYLRNVKMWDKSVVDEAKGKLTHHSEIKPGSEPKRHEEPVD